MSRSRVMVAVAAIIENEEEEILIIKRSPDSSDPNCWEDSGGRLLQSEKPEEGLLREIAEETGISDIEIIKPLTVFQDFKNDTKKVENELIGISFWCKTKTKEVNLSHEHTDFKWVTPEKAMQLTTHKAFRKYIPIYLAEKAKEEKINLLKPR